MLHLPAGLFQWLEEPEDLTLCYLQSICELLQIVGLGLPGQHASRLSLVDTISTRTSDYYSDTGALQTLNPNYC